MLYFLHACYKNILFNLYVTYNVFEEQQIILIKFTINLVVIWPFSCFLQLLKKQGFSKFQGFKMHFQGSNETPGTLKQHGLSLLLKIIDLSKRVSYMYV